MDVRELFLTLLIVFLILFHRGRLPRLALLLTVHHGTCRNGKMPRATYGNKEMAMMLGCDDVDLLCRAIVALEPKCPATEVMKTPPAGTLCAA